MNLKQWKHLNAEVSNDFLLFQAARQNGDGHKNDALMCRLVVNALKMAGVLSKPLNRKKFPKIFEYRSDHDGSILKFGPAAAILASLPDPANLSEEDYPRFYFELVRGAIESRAPADLFLESIDYAISLLPYFQEGRYFNKLEAYETLEADLRKRLLTHECAKFIVGDKEKEHKLLTAYRRSLRRVADTYLRHGDYAGSVGSLIKEFDAHYPDIPDVSDNARYEVLYWTHYYNQLLGVLPSSELPSGFQRVKGALTAQQLQNIEIFEKPDVDGIEMREISIKPLEGYISPDATTRIFVTLPAKLPEGVHQCGAWEVRVVPITDPFADPNFRFVHQQGMLVNGMPMAILSPTIGRAEGSTLVEISTNQPFHPDIEVDKEGRPSETSLDDFKQLHGKDFDPYLAKAAELLILVSQAKWPSRDSIIATLRSADSYAVAFYDTVGKQTYHFYQPLVKLSTFLAARSRFLSRFMLAKEGGLKSGSLKKILFQKSPLDSLGLQRFAKMVFHEFIEVPSKSGEWWKTVWVERSDYRNVRLETDVARDIYSVISGWFEIKGLTLDREVSAAGGSIDMLATSASGSKIHRCGIELKYAHHAKVKHGISRQLPDYMEDLKAETGLFVTLWCKGKNFPEPAKFDSLSKLTTELSDHIPKGNKIEIIAVDASYRPPPSKRR